MPIGMRQTGKLIDVDVNLTLRQLKNVQKLLGHIRGGTERAVRLAVNETAREVSTMIRRRIRALLPGLSNDKPIRRSMHLITAKRGDFKAGRGIAAHLIVDRKRTSLRGFGARQTAKGVTYKDPVTRARQFVKGAFFATITGERKDGSEYTHKGVFLRGVQPAWADWIAKGHTERGARIPNKSRFVKKKSKTTGRTYWSELPIKELKGPAIAEILEKAPWFNTMFVDASHILNKKLQQKVDFLLWQADKKAGKVRRRGAA